MASLMRELQPLPFDICAYSAEQAFLWDNQWVPCMGVADVDFALDARNVVVGAGPAAISLKPAIQFAVARVDRPDDGSLITAGSAVTAAGVTHYNETLSGGGKFFWRRGLGYKLTAGSFARAQGLLYAGFRNQGLILPAEEVVFQPTNDSNQASIFPLGGGRPLLVARVSKAKLAVVGMGNLTTTMNWQLAARAFNDPLGRGDWTILGSASTPNQVNFEGNTSEVSFTGITLANFFWLELGLAVFKTSGGDTNSRCVFHVLPALSYG